MFFLCQPLSPSLFLKVQEAILSEFPDLEVVGNPGPPEEFSTQIGENTFVNRTGQKIRYPRLGSFEVYLANGVVIHLTH